MKKTIEMKIAANGAKLYYRVDENGNKTRVAYKDCYMELAWQAHDNYEAECEANRKAQIDVISDYAVTEDAFQIAVNAEIQAGLKEENTMINRDKFLKVAKVIKCEKNINNAKCWYYNTLADIDTEHWKRISKARANEILFCYGLTAESFLAEQKLIDEETRKRNLEKFAPKEIVHPRTIKAQADFYADKVKRESKPLDNENVFDLLPDLDNLNDFSETDPYLMDDDAEYTDRDARFNYGERYAAALTEKLSQYDPTVEVTYDIDDDDEDVYYLKFDGIYRSPYTLCGIESAFHRLKKDIAEEEFMKNVDGTLDDKIAALHQCRRKRKQVRDSINRAIKQCIRNRIGYLKSHNSKMEKYEYELLCLLQGARRELEIA